MIGASATYNIGSIVLGLMAWILPLAGLALRQKVRYAWAFSTASFSAALLSLTLQFFEIRHRVEVNDFSALMDTIHVLCGVVVVLVVVTMLLNMALSWASRQPS